MNGNAVQQCDDLLRAGKLPAVAGYGKRESGQRPPGQRCGVEVRFGEKGLSAQFAEAEGRKKERARRKVVAEAVLIGIPDAGEILPVECDVPGGKGCGFRYLGGKARADIG